MEYALGAIKFGSTAIGITTKEGVIFASEHRASSPLLVLTSVEKILEIDSHIACTMSGLIADARTLVNHGRTECANHRFVYNEPMPIQSCVESMSELALEFSLVIETKKKKTMSRPFGVALLVGGIDDFGPNLWCTDPSGTNTKFKAAAIGAAQEGAEAMLQEKYSPDMSFEDAEKLIVEILRHVMEEKITKNNVEMACIKVTDKKVHFYKADEIENIIASLPPPEFPSVQDLRS